MTTPEMQLDRLVWIDLETTGLDPQHDEILEAGFIITDGRLNETARRSWVLPCSRSFMERRCDDVVRAMHTASGLWEESAGWHDRLCSMSRHEEYDRIRDEVRAFIEPSAGSPMCGANVSFDRSFCRDAYGTPILGVDLFHYRNLDVSTLRLTGQMLGFTLPPKREVHRALPDLEDSIALMKAFVAQAGGWPDAPRSVVESLR